MADYHSKDGYGRESEWNEASFKSRRLDEIQEAINFFKTNPLGMTDGKFNYFWYYQKLDCLYGEGKSKYSDTEQLEVDNLRTIAKKILKLMPPHVSIRKDCLTGSKNVYIFNEENFDRLMDFLYEFESKIKDYHDKHGLTTKNKQAGGMF